MNYTIEFMEDQKIVSAIAKGDWNSTTDNTMVYKILEMVDATGSSRVLLDIRDLHFNQSMAQLFERVKVIREQRREFGKVSAKAAEIVYTNFTPRDEEDMKFFENAARNRGLPYRSFKDIEEAMTWLTSDV